jgi:hypothetical protein
MLTTSWRRLLGPAVAAAMLLSAASAMGAASLSSLVPGSNEVAGWTALQADTPAATPADLWKIYDGGDKPWKDAGVTSAFQRYYKNAATGHVVTLILHKTGADYTKAKALYNSKNAGFLKQPGYATVAISAAGSVASPNQATQGHSWSKYYYCTVTVNGKTAADITAARQFLTKVGAKITASG